VEWVINPEWTLQVTYDEINTREFRTEARFRRRYAGQWTFGGRGKNPLAALVSLNTTGEEPLPQPPAPPAGFVPADNAVVTRIDLVPDTRIDTTGLQQYVTLKVGEPLSIRAEQTTIKSLFATGDF